MQNFSQVLPRCLIILQLVACFDRLYSLSDDFLSLNKHLIIKVEAGIQGIADVHTHIPVYDVQNGPNESFRWLRCTTGRSNTLYGERLCLNTQRKSCWHYCFKNPCFCSFNFNDLSSYRENEVCPFSLSKCSAHLHSHIKQGLQSDVQVSQRTAWQNVKTQSSSAKKREQQCRRPHRLHCSTCHTTWSGNINM